MNKEVQGLIAEVSEQGFRVITAGKHFKVVDGSGSPVTDAAGPLVIPGSPSSPRWYANTTARFRRAGVLPKSGQENGQTKSAPAVADVALAQKREQSEAEQREKQARTKLIRERVETLVVKMGGWDARGSQARLGNALFAFAQKNEETTPASAASAAMMIFSIKKGNTLALLTCDVIEAFLTTVESADNPLVKLDQLGGVTPSEAKSEREKEKRTAPMTYTQDQIEEVLRLINDEGVSQRKAAEIVFGDVRFKKRVSYIVAASKKGKTPGQRESRGKATATEVAFAASVKSRFSKVFDSLEGKDIDRYRAFWRNGKQLTKVGQQYPGEGGKSDVGSEILGIDHVRKLHKGESHIILNKFKAWWENNLADFEVGIDVAKEQRIADARVTDSQEPPATPEPEPETTPEPELGLTGSEPVDMGTLVAMELVSIPPRSISQEEVPTLALRAMSRMVTSNDGRYASQMAAQEEMADMMEICKEILSLEINVLLSGDPAETDDVS